jgi:hypothetical protein
MEQRDMVELTLPMYWACYLMYGDASGLQDGEAEAIDAYLQEYEVGACINIEDDAYFSWTNDANTGLGGDVCTYTFLKL